MTSFLRNKYLDSSDDENELYNYNQINEIMNETNDNNPSNNSKKEEKSKKVVIKDNILDEKDDKKLLKKYNKILKKYWGYESLKETQFNIIKKVINDKKDVLAILATGYGKSICYQLPYLIQKKSVIII